VRLLIPAAVAGLATLNSCANSTGPDRVLSRLPAVGVGFTTLGWLAVFALPGFGILVTETAAGAATRVVGSVTWLVPFI
jgi:hypothetical protein